MTSRLMRGYGMVNLNMDLYARGCRGEREIWGDAAGFEDGGNEGR